MRRADIKPLPARDILDGLFIYDPENGDLRWRNPRKGMTPNAPAGTVNARGYLIVGIKIDGKTRYYYAHRVIWKMMTGNDPIEQIDHIDNDRLNNRLANLREAKHGQNRQNARLQRDNKSGVKGVCWDSHHKSWRAYISIGGTQHKLGRFKALEDAAKAVTEARIRLHGEFARVA